MRRRLGWHLLAVTIASALALPVVQADPSEDELPPAQDNGAEGRSNIPNPDHVAPIVACNQPPNDTTTSSVIRVLPRGPLAPDGGLAFTSGVCIYLPPGYATSDQRYPVLYLLHGGGGDAANWVTYGGIRSIMDSLITRNASNAAIVVMPDGTDAQWYDSLDGSLRNERYVLDYVIPYVDRHFRTIAERSGRAIDGLSNGGYGAMHLAAKAPDRFVVAGAMSSNLGGRSFSGLGDPITSPAYDDGNVPASLVGNLDGIDITLDLGTKCRRDLREDLCGSWAFEQLFLLDNRYFVSHLRDARGPGDGLVEYRETEGGHSWRWWPLWLRTRHLPFLLARLADPRPADVPPAPPVARPQFRYRSIAPSFSVWGYDVTVQRRVREFLDLRNVGPSGMQVQGSGRALVHTAPIYTPGASYLVSGTGAPTTAVVADSTGRLTIAVDLGPSHRFEQFSVPATVLETLGGYWVVRDVRIRPA
jgi:S-formylglutathione hydrolase FrmB